MMAPQISLSRYHLVVLSLYIVLVPTIIIISPYDLNYRLHTENLVWGIAIVATLCLFGEAILFQRNVSLVKIKLKALFVTLLYAIAFAIPEEILFRGIVQGALSQEISSPFWLVFVSSGIFGVAHIFNGSKGMLPTDWNWKFVTMTFFAGLPLGTLYYLTGSLLLPTILHVLFILFLRFSKAT